MREGGEDLFFSLRFLFEAARGDVEFVKTLVKANATVDKEDNQENTALYYAVKKMENHISEKQPPNVCKCSRYRRILLFSPHSPSVPQCVGDASSDPLIVVGFSHPGE